MSALLQTRPAQAQTMRKKLWRAVVHRHLQQSAQSSSRRNAGGMSNDAHGSFGDTGRKGGWEAGRGAKGGSDGESSNASTTSGSSGGRRVHGALGGSRAGCRRAALSLLQCHRASSTGNAAPHTHQHALNAYIQALGHQNPAVACTFHPNMLFCALVKQQWALKCAGLHHAGLAFSQGLSKACKAFSHEGVCAYV